MQSHLNGFNHRTLGSVARIAQDARVSNGIRCQTIELSLNVL
ncbi:unnamed protein product [Chironomus riparius]|uniref:Uncharacterized protein n=1 Tax=Chironomus riparius TaxID=315576 RepID=A0A9N9S1L4_9DIPT|nr:unnamed protein product [Chironomus riparius]